MTVADRGRRARSRPGLAVYRFGAGLYYANAARFTEEIMGIVERADPPLRVLVILGLRDRPTSTTPGPTRCARSTRSWRARA